MEYFRTRFDCSNVFLLEAKADTLKYRAGEMQSRLDKSLEELSKLNSMVDKIKDIINKEKLGVEILLKNELELRQRIDIIKEEERDKECPICFEVIGKKVKTECGHIFCRECIVAHIKINPKCPMCCREISEKSLVPINQPKDDIGIVQDSPPSSSGGSRVQDFPQSSSGGSRVQEQKEEEERRRLLQLRLRRQDDMMARNMLCNF
jgi:hypothetical protein